MRLGSSQKEIAIEIGVNRSSISRELKRNPAEGGYQPYAAMERAYERRKKKGGRLSPLFFFGMVIAVDIVGEC